MCEERSFATLSQVILRHARQLYAAQAEFLAGGRAGYQPVFNLSSLLIAEGLPGDVIGKVALAAVLGEPFPSDDVVASLQ